MLWFSLQLLSQTFLILRRIKRAIIINVHMPYKSNWLRHVTRMNNNRTPKWMLHYRPNGRRQLGRPLRRLLDEAEAGLVSPYSWCVMMMMITYVFTYSNSDSCQILIKLEFPRKSVRPLASRYTDYAFPRYNLTKQYFYTCVNLFAEMGHNIILVMLTITSPFTWRKYVSM